MHYGSNTWVSDTQHHRLEKKIRKRRPKTTITICKCYETRLEEEDMCMGTGNVDPELNQISSQQAASCSGPHTPKVFV